MRTQCFQELRLCRVVEIELYIWAGSLSSRFRSLFQCVRHLSLLDHDEGFELEQKSVMDVTSVRPDYINRRVAVGDCDTTRSLARVVEEVIKVGVGNGVSSGGPCLFVRLSTSAIHLDQSLATYGNSSPPLHDNITE